MKQTYSKIHKIDCGVPQGTCPAPLLFNVMMADLPQYLKTNVKTTARSPLQFSQYADDIAIWQSIKTKSPTKHFKEIQVKNPKIFQQAINTVQNYLTKNGFEIAPEKNTTNILQPY